MFESDIELKLAYCPEQVAVIVKETIQKVYPHYYPSGAVQFFLDLHSEARIEEVMYSEEIYLVVVRGNVIGTGWSYVKKKYKLNVTNFLPSVDSFD